MLKHDKPVYYSNTGPFSSFTLQCQIVLPNLRNVVFVLKLFSKMAGGWVERRGVEEQVWIWHILSLRLQLIYSLSLSFLSFLSSVRYLQSAQQISNYKTRKSAISQLVSLQKFLHTRKIGLCKSWQFEVSFVLQRNWFSYFLILVSLKPDIV